MRLTFSFIILAVTILLCSIMFRLGFDWWVRLEVKSHETFFLNILARSIEFLEVLLRGISIVSIFRGLEVRIEGFTRILYVGSLKVFPWFSISDFELHCNSLLNSELLNGLIYLILKAQLVSQSILFIPWQYL